jgi:putative sterol carrier protein
MKLFSEEWATTYKNVINTSESYKNSSVNWQEGSIALVATQNNEFIGVLLELEKGVCLSSKPTTIEEANQLASYIIQGDIQTWKEVLSGSLQPLMGIMRGKLKLIKGSLTRLIPYTKAANELVLCAQNIPTEFE